MLNTFHALDRAQKLNFLALAAFMIIAFVFGGASRADVLSTPIVRVAAVLAIALFGLQLDRARWRAARPAMIFLGAIAAIILVQLIPLPPQLWASLPGRSLYVEALDAGGIAPVWRPLSLTPDLTINALLSVLPPVATVLGLVVVDRRLHAYLVPLCLGAVVASAVIGVFQVSTGSFYFYRHTNEGSLVGFFANRNHEAAFLAVGYPLLACWAASPSVDRGYAQVRNWTALCVGAAIVPLILVTGSRGGLILAGMGIAAAAALTFMLRREHGRRFPAGSLRGGLVFAIPIAAGIAAAALTVYLSRDEAIQRLYEAPTNETRERSFPTVSSMVLEYLPVGSGFGSFDTVYRAHEPQHILSPLYLNHAHNDVLEVLIEGGLLPVPLILVFLGWYARNAWRYWLGPKGRDGRLLGRVGAAIVPIVLIASVFDYPLRTPAMAVLFALACMWMLRYEIEAERPSPFEKMRLAA